MHTYVHTGGKEGLDIKNWIRMASLDTFSREGVGMNVVVEVWSERFVRVMMFYFFNYHGVIIPPTAQGLPEITSVKHAGSRRDTRILKKDLCWFCMKRGWGWNGNGRGG